MEPESKELVMSFDPHTIEHLGIKMYSTLPPVISELIANSYDADAENVKIILLDSSGDKKIVIEDDGSGMSFTELNEKFLRIGRDRRYEEGQQQTPAGRKIIGKKGLGKLSFFGIAQEIEIETSKNGFENSFTMNWDDIKNSKEIEYHPKIINKDKKISEERHGTKITLKNLKRGYEFSSQYCSDLGDSISKTFIIDSDFKISIRSNYQPDIYIKNERKYEGLDKQIEWKVPEDILMESDYDKKENISGYLFTTKSPISPKTNMKGITIFSRKKLVNKPEYFSNSISSHFFSYITGWLEIDFIDDLEEDVISTNRQSLNWDHPEMEKLRDYLKKVLNWLERDWHEKRSKLREEELTKKTGINIGDWLSKLPDDLKSKVEPVIHAIMKDSELPSETNQIAVKTFHEIIPEYPRYHWRNLHPEVQAISKNYYISKDYYTALFESAKKYANSVKTKASSPYVERDLLENVFSIKDPVLSVTDKFKKLDGNNFQEDTVSNINEGHRMLAIALWTAFRCPLAHEEVCDLRDSGLFTEKDCLDALSLLSHLFRRLDEAQVKK